MKSVEVFNMWVYKMPYVLVLSLRPSVRFSTRKPLDRFSTFYEKF